MIERGREKPIGGTIIDRKGKERKRTDLTIRDKASEHQLAHVTGRLLQLVPLLVSPSLVLL